MSAPRSRERPGSRLDREVNARLAALRRCCDALRPRPSLLAAVREQTRVDARSRRRPRSRRATLGLAASLLLSFAGGALRGALPSSAPPVAPTAAASGLPRLPIRETEGPAASPRPDSADAPLLDDARFESRLAALLDAALLPPDDNRRRWLLRSALVDPDPDVRALARVLLAPPAGDEAASDGETRAPSRSP